MFRKEEKNEEEDIYIPSLIFIIPILGFVMILGYYIFGLCFPHAYLGLIKFVQHWIGPIY